MDEGEIRQLAAMYAIVADMEATKAQIEGMKADNTEREAHGLALAWPRGSFEDEANVLRTLAKLLRDTI